jgi:hypothetical protein
MLDEEQTPFYEGKQNIGGIEDQGFWTLFWGQAKVNSQTLTGVSP